MYKSFDLGRISIIMPVYNNLDYIQDSILSVINQTYNNWELIIIDDASNVDIKSAIGQYLKEYCIIYFKLEENLGVAAARNRGQEIANGQYLAFLDSDDIWHPQKLEKQISFMKKNDIAFSYTQYRHFSEKDKYEGKLIDVKERVTYKELLKGNIIGCLTVVIDREKIKNIMMRSERHEDYILWLQILKSGYEAYGLKEDLARYRISSNSLSGNKFKSAIWTWRIYRNIEKLNLWESLYYFLHYLLRGVLKRL